MLRKCYNECNIFSDHRDGNETGVLSDSTHETGDIPERAGDCSIPTGYVEAPEIREEPTNCGWFERSFSRDYQVLEMLLTNHICLVLFSATSTTRPPRWQRAGRQVQRRRVQAQRRISNLLRILANPRCRRRS